MLKETKFSMLSGTTQFDVGSGVFEEEVGSDALELSVLCTGAGEGNWKDEVVVGIFVITCATLEENDVDMGVSVTT